MIHHIVYLWQEQYQADFNEKLKWLPKTNHNMAPGNFAWARGQCDL